MGKKKKIEWVKLVNNSILEGSGFYISYNKRTGASEMRDSMTILANALGGNVKDGEETALKDGEIWKILEGDYREEYEEAFPSIVKCRAVYDKYKDKHRSNWSTD